jgi:hypothetical protein
MLPSPMNRPTPAFDGQSGRRPHAAAHQPFGVAAHPLIASRIRVASGPRVGAGEPDHRGDGIDVAFQGRDVQAETVGNANI